MLVRKLEGMNSSERIAPRENRLRGCGGALDRARLFLFQTTGELFRGDLSEHDHCLVRSVAFSRRKKWAGIIAASLLQLAIQQVAYHAWVAVQAAVWWPLVQFIALQYVIALRIGSAPENA